MRRLVVVVLLVGAAVVLGASPASAHPLGNFSVNRSSGLIVGVTGLEIDFVEDLAEIPTVQVSPAVDRDGDGRLGTAELRAYAPRACAGVAAGMRVHVGGARVQLSVQRASAELRPGAAGLPTLLLQCRLRAGYRSLSAGTSVTFSDPGAGRRQGWNEVTARGDGTLLRSDVPRSSPSNRLSAYPAELLSDPPDVRGARLTATPGGSALAGDRETDTGAVVNRVADRLSTAFTGLVGHRLSVGWVLLALLIALALGAAHALAPGHGKTMMAGYLLGRSRAGVRAAVTVAGTVALTHTASVLVLAVLATAATALAPRTILPILGMISGLLVLAVGGGLLRGELRRRRHSKADHGHGHGHDDSHGHHGGHSHGHDHPHPHVHPHAGGTVPGRGGLIGLGLAGGLVPSPSALVVLLGTVAIGRAAYGVALVLAFGIGLAITLALVGLLAARGGTALARLGQRRLPRWPQRLLPVVGAATVLAAGLALTLRGVFASVAVL